MTVTAKTSSVSSTSIPDLITLLEAAAKAASGLRDRARDAVAAKVSQGGKIDGEALERQQHAAHGLAWIATYAEALNQLASYARRMGIRIEPPAVNRSEAGFIPSDGAIRYSLAALRNVGRQAVDHICAERAKRGLFENVSEFARAINPRLVNKRALETLASAGALDELGIDRATALANVDRIMAAGLTPDSAGAREVSSGDVDDDRSGFADAPGGAVAARF